MSAQPHLVTVKEFARLRGVSHVAIVKMVNRGVISRRALYRPRGKKRYMINVEIANLDIEFFGAPNKKPVVHMKALPPQPKPKKEYKTPEPEEENNDPESSLPDNVEQYREAKISTETLKARKLELEVQEREGKLLEAEEVRKRIVKLVGETKDTILNVPAKIAPMLVSITDPVEMETRLLQELNAALLTLSRLDTI